MITASAFGMQSSGWIGPMCRAGRMGCPMGRAGAVPRVGRGNAGLRVMQPATGVARP
ncbi:hypothetical protein RNZ50_10460 [Paracoccaceae bacterium Fryx2]|nr:hypothetical protein [Paracoccaceae bacterium Fryx2]